MSEKVVLTQEQADAIRALRNTNAVVNLLDLKGPLSELKVHDIFKALQGWYEVEKPKFRAGDKVIRKDGLTFAAGEFIWTVVEDQQDSWKAKIVGSGDGWDVFWETASIRHATPEEIFWLHDLSRDSVGEFREGDVFVLDDGYIYKVEEDDRSEDKIRCSLAKLWYSQGRLVGIYPASSFKSYKREE